jgi:hypothetical protein
MALTPTFVGFARVSSALGLGPATLWLTLTALWLLLALPRVHTMAVLALAQDLRPFYSKRSHHA